MSHLCVIILVEIRILTDLSLLLLHHIVSCLGMLIAVCSHMNVANVVRLLQVALVIFGL